MLVNLFSLQSSFAFTVILFPGTKRTVKPLNRYLILLAVWFIEVFFFIGCIILTVFFGRELLIEALYRTLNFQNRF